MEIIVNLVMAVVAIGLIGYPFFVGKYTELPEAPTGVDKKEVVFAALGEIEFDYRMNKLDEEDYRELKSGYQQKALDILEGEEAELDNLLEAEVQKRMQAAKEVEPPHE